ncbi:hypothetical protein D3C87_2009060 [compost metagenome]
MPAISSGWAWRLSAIKPCMLLAMGPSAGFMSVSIGPGCTLFTVMPRGPRSRARPLVRPTMAALLMPYTLKPAHGTRSELVLPMVMTRP